MTSLLAPTALRYVGVCLCSPSCTATGGRAHGPAYQLYAKMCILLAFTLTLFSFITLSADSDNFQELTDSFINFCSLYTTWVYIRTWRSYGPNLQAMLARHQRYLDHYERQCRLDPVQQALFRTMLRIDTLLTAGLLATLLGLIALVLLQACLSRVPPLPIVPRILYPLPPLEGEVDALGASRTLCFSLILLFQTPALLCCGVIFAGLGAMHFALNVHAIFLIRCMKRALELTEEGKWVMHIDVLLLQHQHIVTLIQTNNKIFARPITERLIITYALLGLTAYCLSTDPLGDVKVPIIAAFMIVSLLLMAVLSDWMKDECGSLQESLWRSNWLIGSQSQHRKMLLLTVRVQRFRRDGLAAAGMQDTISMVTFVQVMRSSVSFLQALRNFS